MTEVIMPKMGDGMEEGTLLEWLKKDGEAVKSGEVIGTIQTDKATLELESPSSGTLTGFLISAGDTVPVGKAIAAILKSGESLPHGWGTGNGSTPAPVVEAPATPAAKADAPAATTAPVASRVKISPLARKLATERGVDLGSIVGSGPGGRIVAADVEGAAAPQAQPMRSAPTPAPVSTPGSTFDLNRLRQITAQRTQQSKQEVPHFYVTVEADLEKLEALRTQFKDEGAKLSINDFLIKACAMALREMPQVNASYQGKTLHLHGDVNIGMAVALDDGLTVPVMHHADQLSVRQISERSRDLAGRARSNKLALDELSGSTFSISNMGMLNVDSFAAIINQPNAAIVAIGTARKKVVVNDDDEIEVRLRMNVTGSFDHRVVDGAVGAKFVNLVCSYLENPTRLLG
ncbi:MAG: 2-oxo acid dehydrogenase subunit E2 [Fimbriimonadaceae bacterium]|nr:2-oxo acid dehydrogenase subunit E2 [Fimbriimonadaceae bacterium]